MAKDFLAFLGLVFLTLLIILSVAFLGVAYDGLGIIELPEGLLETPMSLVDSGELEIRDSGIGEVEWSNPLDALPTAFFTPVPTLTPVPTQTPTLVPTPTPVPPLDPLVYRAEVTIRLKSYVSALERWMDANEELAKDNSLISDPSWRDETDAALDDLVNTSQALASVGRPPVEYEGIQALLERVYDETGALHRNYSQALEQHAQGADSSKTFVAASENFTRIKEYLTQAVTKMLASGWSLD